MSPPLNGSSAIRYFEGSDAIEIRDRIIFELYMGLPQMWQSHVEIENYSITDFNRITELNGAV